MVSIAIMGHGVVGSGVAEIFTTHKQKLYASIGEEVYVKKILDFVNFPTARLQTDSQKTLKISSTTSK